MNADVAQLVEQLTRNEQVVRSNRIVGSSFIPRPRCANAGASVVWARVGPFASQASEARLRRARPAELVALPLHAAERAGNGYGALGEGFGNLEASTTGIISVLHPSLYPDPEFFTNALGLDDGVWSAPANPALALSPQLLTSFGGKAFNVYEKSELLVGVEALGGVTAGAKQAGVPGP